MNPYIHIGELIKKHLAAKKRSVAWLAIKLSCDASVLRKALKKSWITTDLLYRISCILDEDFFACYSQLLSECANEQYLPENQAVFACEICQ